MFMARSGARSPIREAILPRSHSPSGDGERKGGASLSLYNASGRLMTAQFIIFYFKKHTQLTVKISKNIRLITPVFSPLFREGSDRKTVK